MKLTDRDAKKCKIHFMEKKTRLTGWDFAYLEIESDRYGKSPQYPSPSPNVDLRKNRTTSYRPGLRSIFRFRVCNRRHI